MKNKVRKTHTVDEDLYKEFLEICDKKSIKASTWINNKIKEFVNQEKSKEKGKD